MNPAFLLYRAALRTLRGVGPLLLRGESKVAQGLAGRRDAAAALVRWGRDARDPARPGIWLHAPSVGEGLQARAVLEAMKTLRPDLQAVYTHFSPSAEGLARKMPADVATYLPWDLPDEVGPVLDAVRPDALVFTKTEAWPELVAAAVARGIPVALVGGTLPPGSSRAGWPARSLLRSTWASMRLVAAFGEEDAVGFRKLGVPAAAVKVTGDPGIDSAAQRARAADPAAPYLAPFHADRRPTLVAGSTWPADDAMLLPALTRAREAVPDLRAVIAPHEPDEGHVRPVVDRLSADGWRVATLDEVEDRGDVSGVDAVVVNRVGVLAHLYTVGDAAYVGGGFHDEGLHSVLEPAAAALPVSFGPKHHNARAAGELLAEEGARCVDGVDAIHETLSLWMGDASVRRATGEHAFGYIQRHLGAAERTAALVDDLLTHPHETT